METNYAKDRASNLPYERRPVRQQEPADLYIYENGAAAAADHPGVDAAEAPMRRNPQATILNDNKMTLEELQQQAFFGVLCAFMAESRDLTARNRAMILTELKKELKITREQCQHFVAVINDDILTQELKGENLQIGAHEENPTPASFADSCKEVAAHSSPRKIPLSTSGGKGNLDVPVQNAVKELGTNVPGVPTAPRTQSYDDTASADACYVQIEADATDIDEVHHKAAAVKKRPIFRNKAAAVKKWCLRARHGLDYRDVPLRLILAAGSIWFYFALLAPPALLCLIKPVFQWTQEKELRFAIPLYTFGAISILPCAMMIDEWTIFQSVGRKKCLTSSTKALLVIAASRISTALINLMADLSQLDRADAFMVMVAVSLLQTTYYLGLRTQELTAGFGFLDLVSVMVLNAVTLFFREKKVYKDILVEGLTWLRIYVKYGLLESPPPDPGMEDQNDNDD